MYTELARIITEGNVRQPLVHISSTALEFHEKLSKDLSANIFIKREDRIDDIGSGHKLRKLSYLVADAVAKQATVLVTVGSVPSNQCKAVAGIACQNNLRAHVIYGGTHQVRPAIVQGNYFLTSLFDPDITWYELCPWETIEQKLSEISDLECRNGAIPYIIYSGASTWPGMMGSIELGVELAYQVKTLGLSEVDLVVPAGSGGTCLGIQIVSERFALPWQIHGICIGEPSVVLKEKLLSIKYDVATRLSGIYSELKGLHLYDIALGKGYDQPQTQELHEMQLALKNYQLMLDPNYMLKTYSGMKQLLKQKKIRSQAAIILVHTGGQIGFFDASAGLAHWHKNHYPRFYRSAIPSGID